MPRSRTKTRPGQSDIANALGVSVSTVSRALAGSDLINSDVKRRVHEVAIQLGYPVKLKQDPQRFDSITVLASLDAFRDTRSSIYNSLLDGIREQSGRYTPKISTVITRSRAPLPAEIDAMLGPRTGCIFLGLTPNSETVRSLAERRVPAIVCNGIDEELLIDSVSPANYFGGAVMARYLMGLGHRKILYLAGNQRRTLQMRYMGFQQQIETLSGDKTACVQSVYQLGAEISEEQFDGFADWINQHRHEATALFCYNDSAAVWALEGIKSMGLKVPEDLSVIGFDDMPIARIASPGLTTFRIDWHEVGLICMQLLHKRMISPDMPAQLLQVGGQLIERQSVKNML